MRKIVLAGVMTFAGIILSGLQTANAQFTLTNGNLAIYRVGDGTAALGSTGTAVFIDEYTTAGTLVQSIAVPTTTSGSNHRLVASGTATSEGLITRSSDGKSLVFAGYDAALGTTGVKSSGTLTIGIIKNGATDTATSTTTLNGDNIRGVAYDGGSGFWLSGANGLAYVNYASSGAGTSLRTANTRAVSIYNNQLYLSTGAGTGGVYSLGTGKPTSGTPTATSVAASSSPYQFQLLDESANVAGLDTLYLADDGGSVKKFTFDGSSWNASGTTSLTNVRGLTAVDDGHGGVTLFATTSSSTGPGGLYKIADTSGFGNTLTAAATLLASASSNTAFRGVAFTPVPEPTSMGLIGMASIALLARRRRSAKA